MFSKLPIIVFVIIISTLNGIAQSKVGTTAAQFLGIPVGAKGIAMGGAFVASATDATSLYWNPGAAAQTTNSEFVFSNTEWLVQTKFQWFGLLVKLDNENTFGVNITNLGYGEEEITTESSPEGTGERWSANDFAFALSYSRRLTDKFSIGGSAKYVTQRIWNESASTMTFDVGLLYVTDFNGMRLGMSMSNFGGDLTLDGRDLYEKLDTEGESTLVGKLKTDAWPTPLFFRVGVAMDVIKNDMVTATLAVDALRPNDSDESVNLGTEIGWQNMIFVRGGYKSFLSKESFYNRETQQEGLSLGAGLKYTMENIASIEVNYAFYKFGSFGNLNTIALAIGF